MTQKKAGSCAEPACVVNAMRYTLSVDHDIAEAFSNAYRDDLRLKTGRHLDFNLQLILLAIELHFLPREQSEVYPVGNIKALICTANIHSNVPWFNEFLGAESVYAGQSVCTAAQGESQR